MSKVETYILGQGKAPGWLNDEAKKGRVIFKKDEDGNTIGAKINAGIKVYNAIKGDTIVKSINGIVVIPKDKAKKYGVNKNVKANKEKDNTEGIQQNMDE